MSRPARPVAKKRHGLSGKRENVEADSEQIELTRIFFDGNKEGFGQKTRTFE